MPQLYAKVSNYSESPMVKELPPETARECYVQAAPEFRPTVRDLDSRLVLYKAGSIWSVPAIYPDGNAGLAVDDQKWLIHRLGTEDSAANRSQPIRAEPMGKSSAAGSRGYHFRGER
jgi:hypothetical protein